MSNIVITLREFTIEDMDAIAIQLNSASVTRYLSSKIPFPYTKKDAKRFIEEGSKSGVNRAIEHQGCLVGAVGVALGQFEHERSGEIGFWLGESHWSKGIATEAVSQLTSYIFENTCLLRLAAPVFSPNIASMRVLQKCGYQLESVQQNALYKHGEFYDSHIFVKLNS